MTVDPPVKGVVQHDQASLVSQQPKAQGLRSEWNGKTVRMPGYIVPLDFDGAGVTTFLLVPYVGACIHVPPPPANQLVLVETARPYTYSGLFEAIEVTGLFETSAVQTDLADVGYKIAADEIGPYAAR